MTALSLRGVTKRYGSLAAALDVHLEVEEGEIVTLVGPSGCGKSTLLRLVAGLERSDAGTITIGGELSDDGRRHRPPEHRRVGMVFQDHALFPHLDVAANVAFGLTDVPRDRRAAEVAAALERVGLPGLGARMPHELSGGEQQRVALARALAPRPSVVLLDEPFSSLDENLRARVRADTVAALRDTGSAALLVTHDQVEALALGDRVAVLDAGGLEQLGTPQDVFDRPRSRFVATFMGEADVLPATYDDGRVACELGALPLSVPPSVAEGRTDDLEVLLRPHDLEVVADAGSAARVVGSEYHGVQTAHVVRLPSGATITAWSAHRTRHAEGTPVTVTVLPGSVPVLVRGEDVVATTRTPAPGA
ncbi:ABC transporter ATP-binding protein [Nocardioides sp. CFH 31398]|uniref:ABC transporter ATP-binding protein n=1 Tax=Nocardioides sp. CFH 31398 TaxID=2919579 RepID=UPI001F0543D7|nr:ABC transporter ATP-binding protein [Nocardioides sp. CFH 31398]MCH1868705.1 ABC transporter ATP-binding protein [Nocardioides sp. CFH 31398]